MSINLGLYDFFSYLIPGLLYIYVFNEFLRNIGVKFFDVGTWLQSSPSQNLFVVIPILMGAYIAGHVFDPISHEFFKFLFHLQYRRKKSEQGLLWLKNRFPDLDIQFNSKDWSTLFSFIRMRNIEMARIIDKYSADSIMLRNIAFGSLLFSILQLVLFFLTGNWNFFLFSAISFCLCFFSARRSNEFSTWFFTDIFRVSLEYGSSLKEVVDYSKEKGSNKKRIVPKSVQQQKNTKPRKHQ